MFTRKGVNAINTFGEKLKRHRLAAKMTQEDLARKCGLQKQSISRYEKSDREPNIRIASALADALGISLESLVNSPPSRNTEIDLQFFAEGSDKNKPAVFYGLSDKQKEFIQLVSQLSDQEVSFLLAQVKGLLHDQQSRDDQ